MLKGLTIKKYIYLVSDVSKIEKPPGIPGVIGKVTLPQVKCTVHEQDDGTIVGVCATGLLDKTLY